METVACLRSKCHYTPTRREGAILQYIVSPSVRPFTLSLKMSQLLLEEMILFLIQAMMHQCDRFRVFIFENMAGQVFIVPITDSV
jgi:hypothetical protein